MSANNKASSLSAEALLKWLSQSSNGGLPNHELLLTGLRATDNPRHEIGIVDAHLLKDEDGSTYVALTLLKPNKRTASESDYTVYFLDPEALAVALLHVIGGGELKLHYSKSHSLVDYHYLVLKVPDENFIRYHRLISNTPAIHLGASGRPDFHDLRRKSLGMTKTRGEVTRQHGEQQGGRYRVRSDIIAASVAAYSNSGCRDAYEPKVYRDLLLEGYRLLDLKPLGVGAKT